MGEESPERAGEQSFSDLTVELIEQAAALAGERLGRPIRAAGSSVARMLIVAGLALAAAVAGLVFLAIAIGLLVGMAPAGSQWWICLLTALAFLLTAAAIGLLGFRRRPRAREGKSCEPAE